MPFDKLKIEQLEKISRAIKTAIASIKCDPVTGEHLNKALEEEEVWSVIEDVEGYLKEEEQKEVRDLREREIRYQNAWGAYRAYWWNELKDIRIALKDLLDRASERLQRNIDSCLAEPFPESLPQASESEIPVKVPEAPKVPEISVEVATISRGVTVASVQVIGQGAAVAPNPNAAVTTGVDTAVVVAELPQPTPTAQKSKEKSQETIKKIEIDVKEFGEDYRNRDAIWEAIESSAHPKDYQLLHFESDPFSITNNFLCLVYKHIQDLQESRAFANIKESSDDVLNLLSNNNRLELVPIHGGLFFYKDKALALWAVTSLMSSTNLKEFQKTFTTYINKLLERLDGLTDQSSEKTVLDEADKLVKEIALLSKALGLYLNTVGLSKEDKEQAQSKVDIIERGLCSSYDTIEASRLRLANAAALPEVLEIAHKSSEPSQTTIVGSSTFVILSAIPVISTQPAEFATSTRSSELATATAIPSALAAVDEPLVFSGLTLQELQDKLSQNKTNEEYCRVLLSSVEDKCNLACKFANGTEGSSTVGVAYKGKSWIKEVDGEEKMCTPPEVTEYVKLLGDILGEKYYKYNEQYVALLKLEESMEANGTAASGRCGVRAEMERLFREPYGEQIRKLDEEQRRLVKERLAIEKAIASKMVEDMLSFGPEVDDSEHTKERMRIMFSSGPGENVSTLCRDLESLDLEKLSVLLKLFCEKSKFLLRGLEEKLDASLLETETNSSSVMESPKVCEVIKSKIKITCAWVDFLDGCVQKKLPKGRIETKNGKELKLVETIKLRLQSFYEYLRSLADKVEVLAGKVEAKFNNSIHFNGDELNYEEKQSNVMSFHIFR